MKMTSRIFFMGEPGQFLNHVFDFTLDQETRLNLVARIYDEHTGGDVKFFTRFTQGVFIGAECFPHSSFEKVSIHGLFKIFLGYAECHFYMGFTKSGPVPVHAEWKQEFSLPA